MSGLTTTLVPGAIEFTCPCGKTVRAGQTATATAAAPAGTPVVLHAAPPCRQYLELEPDKYLTYVRREFGLPEPPDDEG